ncbi:MAG TPA: hypothetical protein VG499_14505, partial [Actinomycetota bacterium]|nr:hypothetical protein [Actinomycetota bacterium]
DLPLSLAVAAHLLEDLDPPPGRIFAATVPRSLGPLAAATIGHTLATTRLGLVVMADLSARRTERAPGAFHPDAADFDAQVADAFRTGTPQRLLALDPTQSADLLVTGRAPLQVLAGAFDRDPSMQRVDTDEGGPAVGGTRLREADTAAGAAETDEVGTASGGVEQGAVDLAADAVPDKTGSGVRGRVLYEGAPYGVGYLVALLTT